MSKSNTIEIKAKPGDDKNALLAKTATRPTVQAASTISQYTQGFGELDLMSLVDTLSDQIGAIKEGDIDRSTAMLAAQAHTLDAIFNNLARRAINADYMDSLDRYLKLALKAQSQCRATWEAVSAIKNPPVVGYVKQANISHGPQQVNNSTTLEDEEPAAEKNQKMKNKLLEEKDGEWMDSGAACTSGRTDQTMAALG